MKDGKQRGWESRRLAPNRGSYRDIPRGAVLHRSLLDRLMKFRKDYRPGNNHGDGTDQCLATGDKVTIYDAGIHPTDPRYVDKLAAKFRIHERVEVTVDEEGKRVKKRVPDKEEDVRHQTYDFNHYGLEKERERAEKDEEKKRRKALKAKSGLE